MAHESLQNINISIILSGLRDIIIISIKEDLPMTDKNKNRKFSKPTVAPGFSDEKFGEDASRDDIRKGNYTKVTRVFLDENDPSKRG